MGAGGGATVGALGGGAIGLLHHILSKNSKGSALGAAGKGTLVGSGLGAVAGGGYGLGVANGVITDHNYMKSRPV
jgi:hypothetical protein